MEIECLCLFVVLCLASVCDGVEKEFVFMVMGKESRAIAVRRSRRKRSMVCRVCSSSCDGGAAAISREGASI